ncbi:hypothetical protein [Kitasatospora purpeofusca]|uniref:hypothetical protein n=1 Tax=Kitasatospora purpeofusca TaxID=67352 RepID=UPI0038658905|nr:hypothetical protein OIP63_24440 [Kitasatospora purpeofusca]
MAFYRDMGSADEHEIAGCCAAGGCGWDDPYDGDEAPASTSPGVVWTDGFSGER